MKAPDAKVAFVGCGTHATNNLYPMLAYARARLDAVCELNRALAERNARIFGAASVYTDAERMLEERKPAYHQADAMILTDHRPPKEVVQQVLHHFHLARKGQ